MKDFTSSWNIYERSWLFAFCAVAVWVTAASGDSLFGFFVFLSGVLCMFLAAKGSILSFPPGIFNAAGYAWLSWQNGLYGEAIGRLFFYLPVMVAGFLMWRKHIDSRSIVAMRKLPYKTLGYISSACLAFTIVLGFILKPVVIQNTPYIAAASNVLAVAAAILMIRRYREQWVAYTIFQALLVIMWVMRIADGSSEGPIMAVMWLACLVNSVYGLYNWTKGAEKAEKAAARPH